MKFETLATALLLTTPCFIAPVYAQQEICIVDRNNEVVCGRPASERDSREYERNRDSQSGQFRRRISIVSREGKCIDVAPEGNNQNGTSLQLWDCNGSGSQRWTYDSESSTIRGSGGKCIDAASEGRNNNGTKLQLWSCNGDSNQQWTYNPDDGTIRSGGKCIDAASEGRNNNGTRLQLWNCNSGRNQKWKFFRG